jgi:hypothetical protein
MLKSVRVMSAAAILMVSATQANAGGFILLVGNPQASAEARARGAALTIKAAGCHEPERSAITAHAIGMVDGERKTVELRVFALREPGTYGVAREWPARGQWVLKLTAKNGDMTTTTVARVGAGGVEYKTAKHHATEADVTAMLERTAAHTAARR